MIEMLADNDHIGAGIKSSYTLSGVTPEVMLDSIYPWQTCGPQRRSVAWTMPKHRLLVVEQNLAIIRCCVPRNLFDGRIIHWPNLHELSLGYKAMTMQEPAKGLPSSWSRWSASVRIDAGGTQGLGEDPQALISRSRHLVSYSLDRASTENYG